MRFTAMIGAGVLALGLTAAAQDAPRLEPTDPLTLVFTNSPALDVLNLVARYAKIEVRFEDDSVSRDLRRRKLTFRLENGTIEDALALILSSSDVTYTVVDPKTIRIERKSP